MLLAVKLASDLSNMLYGDNPACQTVLKYVVSLFEKVDVEMLNSAGDRGALPAVIGVSDPNR